MSLRLQGADVRAFVHEAFLAGIDDGRGAATVGIALDIGVDVVGEEARPVHAGGEKPGISAGKDGGEGVPGGQQGRGLGEAEGQQREDGAPPGKGLADAFDYAIWEVDFLECIFRERW